MGAIFNKDIDSLALRSAINIGWFSLRLLSVISLVSPDDALSWLPELVVDRWGRHIACRCREGGEAFETLPRTPLRGESSAVCLFDCCDFHSLGPAGGGLSDRRFTDSGPLSASYPRSVWERAAHHPHAPRHMTCEFLMLVVNGLQWSFCCY